MAESAKKWAWKRFDRIVAEAMRTQVYLDGPWDSNGGYVPDVDTLQKLLGVPLLKNATSQSGVPALALDVWVAYELRRSGFDQDAVWPRGTHPRVMPKPVANYLELSYKGIQPQVRKQLERATPLKGVVATDARILGRHYIKQVDVVMSSWETGPEVLISTKRMDSSFGKNAANRIEEAYGDAKNLRSRHPLAAHGFLYGLRSTILAKEPDKAKWLIDLLGKLSREDDAYDAVCLLLLDYEGAAPEGSDGGHGDEENAAAIPLSTEIDVEGEVPDEDDTEDGDAAENEAADDVAKDLGALPHVRVIGEPTVPATLTAGAFMKHIVEHVLSVTPVTMHARARQLRGLDTIGDADAVDDLSARSGGN